MTDNLDRHIENLPPEQLQPNPLQPRGLITSDSLNDLVSSIQKHGIMEPLIVAKTPVGYQIIAGERRWRAAKLAGMKTVPCVVQETTPRGMLEMALVENVQREDLNPIERAQAFKRLIGEFNLGPAEIAERIGKSIAYVSNSLRLLGLPDAVKDGLVSSLISEGHARALAGVHNTKIMLEAYKMVLKNAYSVRATEELARRANKETVYQKSQQPEKIKSHEHIFSEDTEKICQEISQALDSSPVSISRSHRETRIVIVLKGNLESTEKRLQIILKGITG